MKKLFPVLALGLLLGSCKEPESSRQSAFRDSIARDTARVLPNSSLGVVEVLNGSGIRGAAVDVARFLQSRGFDVVKTGNAPDKNFAHTVVAARRPGSPVARRIADAFGTPRVIPYTNENLLVDATVYVGRDIQEILKHE